MAKVLQDIDAKLFSHAKAKAQAGRLVKSESTVSLKPLVNTTFLSEIQNHQNHSTHFLETYSFANRMLGNGDFKYVHMSNICHHIHMYHIYCNIV